MPNDPNEINPQPPEQSVVDPIPGLLEEIAGTADHSLVQGDQQLKATKDLEAPLEGILLKAHEIAKNSAPKEIQKIQIVQPTDNENELSKALWELLRGRPGHTPTDEELLTLIQPLIPAPTPAPTDEELVSLILPLIPAPIPGDDGDEPTTEQLLALIRPLIPPAIPGKDALAPTTEEIAAIAKPIIKSLVPKSVPGKDGSPDTGVDIVRKHKELEKEQRISYDDLKDLPNLDLFRRQQEKKDIATKDYATSELTDVSMQGIAAGQVLQWDGHRFIPYTPTSSGFNQVFGENLTLQGLGPAFTLAHTPIVGSVRLYRGGAYQQVGVDYTISGSTVTLTNALISGEVLLADYNY